MSSPSPSSRQVLANNNAQSPKNGGAKKPPVSMFTTVVVVFVTHGLVNAALLSGWNHAKLRCLYWNLSQCSPHQSWILNWLALGQCHVCLLIATLGWTAKGNPLLEQRVAHLTSALMVSTLSNGVFMLDNVNKPMALVQGLLYFGLLKETAVHSSILPARVEHTPTISQIRSISYDSRQKISFSTLVVGLLFLLSTYHVLDMTFLRSGGGGRQSDSSSYYSYLGDTSGDDIFDTMSSASITQRLWTTLILGWSTALATRKQHRALLAGHAVALFGEQVLLAGWQGQQMNPDQALVASLGNFGTLFVAITGWYLSSSSPAP